MEIRLLILHIKLKGNATTTTLLSGATCSDYEKIFGSLVGESKTSDTTCYPFLEIFILL